jgi:leucyl-tRNA synthetase
LQSDAIEKAVIEDQQSKKWIEGKQIKKIIIVPGKIINVVVA